MSFVNRSAKTLFLLFFLPLATVIDATAATITAKPSASTDFADGGFEQPAIGPSAIALKPDSDLWTFAGSGIGYASNGSGFGAPAAPDGTQVLYIQHNAGSATQSFLATTGRYRISFKIAQRAGESQKVLVSIDGGPALVFTPLSTSFVEQSFEISLTGGAHSLALSGQTMGDHSAFVDSVAVTPVSHIDNGSFEQPNIGANAIVQAPTVTGWTFTDSTGFASNGSLFNNANAPSGTQVLYIQGGVASVSWQFAVNATMRYRLSFKAAQRLTNTQRIKVMIDNTEVGTVQPASSAFETFDFDALQLGTGTHEIRFVGQNGAGDNTAFIDNVTLTSVVASAWRWSDPDAWDLARVPVDGDDVVIPAGSTMLLDANPTIDQGLNPPLGLPIANTIAVEGELHCDDADIRLAAKSVMVTGRFICGSPYTPYFNTFALTLSGSQLPTSAVDMGNKVLGAMSPGIIELHGASRTNWTQLNGTIEPGATELRLLALTNWQVGDKIAIAPTGDAVDQAEVVTITEVADGRHIFFSPPLQYRHYGALPSTYTNGTTTWTLDERAEVGLLTRNLKIQGDEGSSASQFGGHIMTMIGSSIRASGIELNRMGQKAIKARYPFHWHNVGEAPGQYIINSSVHESYNRCITVHGTNRTLVANNVCYDFIGHGYFLEDGNEQYNVFDGNLGVGAKRPASADAILETDYRNMDASSGPAIYWISNPTNTFTNNVAAGTPGSAFWYHIAEQAPEQSGPNPPPEQMNPNEQPFGVFDNNRAHSSKQGFSSCREGGFSFGMKSSNVLINRLSVSSVAQGVWPCALNSFTQNAVFNEMIVANTGNGLQAPTPFTFRNSVFVAYTANKPANADVSKEVPWFAVAMYDHGFLMENVRFVNYDQRNMSVFTNRGGAGKLASNRTSGLSFQNSPYVAADVGDMVKANFTPFWADTIYDLDGTLVGAGKTLVLDHSIMYDRTCTRSRTDDGVVGYACPYRYSQFRMDWSAPSAGTPSVTQLRSDGTYATGLKSISSRYISNFPNIPYVAHSYRFDKGIERNDLALSLYDAFDGDTSIHQIMDVPTTASIDENSIDPVHSPPQMRPTWQQATSVATLKSGPGHQYYYDADSASLWVKMLAKGEEWHASDYLRVCLTSGRTCELTARAVFPPTVTFTSPERVAAGLVNVTANVVGSGTITSAKLFVNDILVADDTVAPYQYSTSLATGTYVLKLVATNTIASTPTPLHSTFTGIQTLTVGEPKPRVEITAPAQYATFDGDATPAAPTLTFSGHAQAGGTHLHLIDNGIDKGDVTSGALALQAGQFSGGRHDLEIAWARDSDHVVFAGGARRTVYITKNRVLADMEDGLDYRFALTANDAPIAQLMYANSELPKTGRVDGTDDYISYDVNNLIPGQSGYVTARMSLARDHDWSAYTALRVAYSGPGMEVFLRYSNRAPVQLGFVPAAGYLEQALPFGTKPRDHIVGIDFVSQAPPPWTHIQGLTEIRLEN